MTSWRHQVPVHSPLSAAALLAGISGIARNGSAAARQEARVVGLLSKRYGPREVLLTDSGTTALTAVLIGLLREGRGMPIAVPAYGCYDLATAAMLVRGCDIWLKGPMRQYYCMTSIL